LNFGFSQLRRGLEKEIEDHTSTIENRPTPSAIPRPENPNGKLEIIKHKIGHSCAAVIFLQSDAALRQTTSGAHSARTSRERKIAKEAKIGLADAVDAAPSPRFSNPTAAAHLPLFPLLPSVKTSDFSFFAAFCSDATSCPGL
jgi:hypothetical protein